MASTLQSLSLGRQRDLDVLQRSNKALVAPRSRSEPEFIARLDRHSWH
jgi:hypothetical protein